MYNGSGHTGGLLHNQAPAPTGQSSKAHSWWDVCRLNTQRMVKVHRFSGRCLKSSKLKCKTVLPNLVLFHDTALYTIWDARYVSHTWWEI